MKLAATLSLAVALAACGPSSETTKSPAEKMCETVAKHVRRDCEKTISKHEPTKSCKDLGDKTNLFCTKAHEESNTRSIEIICKAYGDSVIQNCDLKDKKSKKQCTTKGKKKERKCLKKLGPPSTTNEVH